MKKVGIVACYFQHNYGSMLQAYATQYVLDKLEIENEIISVSGFIAEINKSKRKYFIKACFTSDFLAAKIGRIKNEIIKKISRGEYKSNIRKRKLAFNRFCNEWFNLSEQYPSLEALSKKCADNYSAVLVGSDQLWLPGNIAANYYTLSFVPEEVNTIAYSTSFGVSSLPEDISRKAKEFLLRIKHLSVREESGRNIIESLVERRVPIVCDPTLLLTGEEWMHIQNEVPLVDGDYILCYFLGGNPLHREFVRNLRKHTGYKIVGLLHIDELVKSEQKMADVELYDITPADFLNLIRNAKYVCTDSFHCSVFSILYKTKFFSFRRFADKSKQSTNSRLDTLFNITGIRDRMLVGDENVSACIAKEIDFETAHIKISKFRKESFDYLKTALLDQRSTDL